MRSTNLLLALAFTLVSAGARADFIAVTWEGQAVRLDQTTAAATTIGPCGFVDLNSLARLSDGQLVAASKSGAVTARILKVDPVTGDADMLHFPFLNDIRALAVSPSGVLYAIDSNASGTQNTLYWLDLSVPVGDSSIKHFVGQTTIAGIQGMEFAPDGSLYAWSVTHGLVLIDAATGSTTDVNGAIDGSSIVQTLAFAPDGTLFGAYEFLYRIDLMTGQTTQVGGPTNASIRGFEFFDFTATLTYCHSKRNSQGCEPQIGTLGTPSASGPDTFFVTASEAINNKTGLLLWSLGAQEVPFQGGSLCLAPPLNRTPPQSSGGNPPPDDCSGVLSYHFTQSYMAANALVPGTTVHAQYYYRDVAHFDGTGVGLSNAVQFTIAP
jgi:hypothetical protein